MSDLIKKLTRYEILNHLITGSTALIIYKMIWSEEYSLASVDVSMAFIVLSYAVGFFFAGVGSIMIEPIAKAIVGFYAHSRYASAAERNPFIRTIQCQANMSRTFVVVFLGLFILAILKRPELDNVYQLLVVLGIIIAFLFLSYLKSICYVKKFIEEEENKQECTQNK